MRVNMGSVASTKTYTADFPMLTGGLNLWELDYRLDANQSPNMKNLWWQDGVLQCRDGQRYISGDTSHGKGYACSKNLFWGVEFFHIGEKLMYCDPTGATVELVELLTGVPENRGTFFRYKDWLFYKNKGGFYQITYNPDKEDVFSAKSVVEDAFVPVTVINASPVTGSGAIYQPENRLSPKKTVWYNADGSAKYQLPVKELDSVDKVEVDGTEVTDHEIDLTAGTVTFKTAPAKGTTNNTVKITFSKQDEDALNAVMDCEYAIVAGEDKNLCILLGGCDAQPNGVFWNSNDEYGMNPAYFPITYYNLVGDTEDPVTGFGKQYSDLIVFKEHSIGKLDFSIQSVEDRDSLSFGYSNVNSKIGCDLPWSIQLVENNLVFCNSYQGVHMVASSSSAYENNVVSLSRNVDGTDLRGLLHDVRESDMVTSFDDDDRYWLCANGNVYLWDYVLSTSSDPSWFFFTNVKGVSYFHDDEHRLYHLDGDGKVTRFERIFADYDGPIEKVYQFPTMMFGSYDRLKDVMSILVAVRSDTDTEISIRYDTDYETRYDLTNIQSNSWRLSPRNLAYRYMGVSRYAHVVRRKPGCRHVRHFAMTFSNNIVGCDLAIVSAQVFYKFQGRER